VFLFAAGAFVEKRDKKQKPGKRINTEKTAVFSVCIPVK